MYIEKMMRRATALLVMLVAGVSALLAQPRLYVEDFSISAGETKQVAVCLDNTGVTDANTLSMTIKVPTGMTIETKDVGFSKPVMDVTMNNQRAIGFSAIGNAANGYLSLTSTGNTIAEGDGAVFYIKVTAADNLPVTSQLELENAVLSRKSGTSCKSADGTLTVENATVTKLDDITVAFAQNPITMEPGGTYSMAVEMKNTGKEVTGFQADLVLPNEEWTATIANGRLVNSGSGYRILSSSISGEEGTLFTINLVAPASFKTGSAEVTLKNIYATVGTSEEQLANITLKVNANGGAVSDQPVLTFVQNEVAIAAGKTGKVDVNLQNPGMDVKGFQADVVLPTGWSATVENGRLVNAGNDSRVMYSDFMNSIPGEDGVLFSLNVTTAADFAGEAEVKLQNIYVTVGFKEVALEDITVKVKSHDDATKAEVDAIIATLQQTLDDVKAELAEEKVTEMQGLIDGLKTEVEEQYNAGTLDAAATQTKADAIAAQIDHARAMAYIQNYVNDLTKDVEALVVPDEVKSYTNKEVQALVQTANQAIGQAGGTRAGVMSALSQVQYNPTSTYDQVVSTVEQVKSVMGPLIAAAQTAIEAAVAKYNEVKPLEDAQKTLAEETLAALQQELATLVIPEEVAASENSTVKEAVGAATQAIANANGAVNQGVTAVLNQYANNLTSEEGAAKLKEATEQAQAAIDAAKAAIEAAVKAAEEAAARIPGDITGTGDVTDADFDAFVEAYTTGQVPAEGDDDFYAFDANGDGVINIADMQAIFNLSMGLNADGSDPGVAARVFGNDFVAGNLNMSAVKLANGNTRFDISLSSTADYRAFQMDLKMNGAMRVVGETANVNLRSSDNGSYYRIVGWGQLQNGNIVSIEVEGNGNVQFDNVMLATAEAQPVAFTLGNTTGISTLAVEKIEGAKVFDLSGKETTGLTKGINIVRSDDGTVKKVMK